METIQFSNETRILNASDLVLNGRSRPDGSQAAKFAKRAQVFYDKLNREAFRNFTHAVSMAQIEAALEYLDENFDQWDADETLADWEYVLPAIHKLFPEQRVFGYTAKFSPTVWAQSGFGLLLWLSISIGLVLTGVCAICVYSIWKH